MKITADHSFHIGSQHLRGGLPCQDYANSGHSKDMHYAILSDGCSTGGKTDVGARVVAHSTASVLTQMLGSDSKSVDSISHWRMEDARAVLRLEPNDLLATCAYVVTAPEMIEARVIGDGVIVARGPGNIISMTRIDWANNMPAYPIYRRDGYSAFIEAHGGERDGLCATVTRCFHTRYERGEGRVEQRSLGDVLHGISDTFSPDLWDFIAVFSDGVTQVDGMDWKDVVTALTDFKSFEGDFVKRRMNRFLKDCQKYGKGPIDDISMAAIHINHEATP